MQSSRCEIRENRFCVMVMVGRFALTDDLSPQLVNKVFTRDRDKQQTTRLKQTKNLLYRKIQSRKMLKNIGCDDEIIGFIDDVLCDICFDNPEVIGMEMSLQTTGIASIKINQIDRPAPFLPVTNQGATAPAEIKPFGDRRNQFVDVLTQSINSLPENFAGQGIRVNINVTLLRLGQLPHQGDGYSAANHERRPLLASNLFISISKSW